MPVSGHAGGGKWLSSERRTSERNTFPRSLAGRGFVGEAQVGKRRRFGSGREAFSVEAGVNGRSRQRTAGVVLPSWCRLDGSSLKSPNRLEGSPPTGLRGPPHAGWGVSQPSFSSDCRLHL